MRSYGKNFMYRKTATFKERQVREATEWDVRIDVVDGLTADDVVQHLQVHQDELLFALVGGIELPDVQVGQQHPNGTAMQVGSRFGTTSTDHHVHVCIVLYAPLKRVDVLKMVRGPRKMGDEYCAPRNPKFTYAGWVIHHAKPKCKVDGEPLIRFEHGTLPMDPFTTDSAVAIARLLKKWSSPLMARRFKGYMDLLEQSKIKTKIEQYTMLLEDRDAW